MEFSNVSIDIEQLPKAEEVDLQPIDARYWKVILYTRLMIWGICFLAAGTLVYFIDEMHNTRTIVSITAGAILFATGNFVLGYLSFKNKSFAVREHDILYQTGWFITSLHVCPFNRIQHCSLDSGVFERKFGLSKLNIYSAGGDDSDIEIQGLTTTQAAELRDLIIAKIGAE
ncbi:MAG: hypothetical protein EOO94_04405 [Pedobacter sp.]|nr:MAG: hypothetical protein EOO94_04405 [Pedobacter sp.]